MDEWKSNKTEVLNLVAEDVTPTDGFSTKPKYRPRKHFTKFQRTFPQKHPVVQRPSNRDDDESKDEVPVAKDSLTKHDTGASEINPVTIQFLLL
ncbi:unnamed protein product [Anisakis simplex]|uniref:Uncharacterized protein n=1 Tax=Anisakis simplex TaxID=6269 RepID=A0A0M3JUN4_ANISI|nr:unnamed protein product [Anisakis simplex]